MDCSQKQQELIKLFEKANSPQEKYELIISMGKKLSSLEGADLSEETRVQGCQSLMHLKTELTEKKTLKFEVSSDALISKGLAALLIYVYEGETPETLLQVPPSFAEKIALGESLTPTRVNGFYQIHLKMKQDAIQRLINS